MDIQHHMVLVERAIAGVFVAHSLYVHLCGNVQGPHTLTFGLRLYEPTQKNITKALGLSAALEAAIANSPVRVYMDNGLIYVEVPSPGRCAPPPNGNGFSTPTPEPAAKRKPANWFGAGRMGKRGAG